MVLVVAAMPLAAAQDEASVHPFLSNKFFASIGLFVPSKKMELSLDASVDVPDPDPEPAPLLDFSQTFGFTEDDETGSAEIGWRFGKKWQLRGQYFRVDNNTRAVLQEDVEWGDYVFNSGTSVAAGTDFQITRLFFGRSFLKTNEQEFGLGIGVHILDARVFINGNATVNGVDMGFREEAASISQPLPNLGIWYMHAFTSKWAFNARLDWLSATVGDYDGRIINSAASISYAMNDHFGIGLAYNFFEIDLKINDPDWNGRVIARFDGPYLSVNGYW
jgi:hypothetical protein